MSTTIRSSSLSKSRRKVTADVLIVVEPQPMVAKGVPINDSINSGVVELKHEHVPCGVVKAIVSV